MQVEAQLRIRDLEASTYLNDFKARRTRSPREAIDGVVRHTPGPFYQRVQELPVDAKSIEVGV